MSRASCLRALAAATFALSLASPGRAQPTASTRRTPLAQSLPSDARRDYDAGKLLFEDGDYATALLMYQTAYDRTHDARLLWNVAACQKNLRRYAKAAALLRRYLVEGGDLLSAGDRRDAQDLSKAIAPFTVAMKLDVDEPGAQVWVDDEPVGTSPLPAPVVLDMGTRRVRVKKEGFRLVERDVPVGGSAATTFDVVLQRESGRLELTAPASAAVFVDEKEAGRGPHLALDLPIGAHALRVTAPRMRPLQRDVIVEDGRTRTLDLSLEADAAPSAEVHVAVACLAPDPLPQEGLAVFFDDATESALPLGVRMRREDEREVVAYVPYRVAPGRHALHVAAPMCVARDVAVNVAEGQVADVKGELPPAKGWLNGSPAGSPDGWRVTAGLIESSLSFSHYDQFAPTAAGLSPSAGAVLVGPMAAAGLQGRWLSGLVDARFQVARVVPPGALGSTLSQWSVGVRPGARFPLVIAAVSAGIDLRIGQFFMTPDSQGNSQSGLFTSAAFWTALDLQPFCEWGLQFAFAPSFDTYSAHADVGASGVTSLWLHATYTPNGLCTRQHAGQMKIEATTH
jgi:hypothetical protein